MATGTYPVPQIGLTAGASFIPEVWSSEILRSVEHNLVLADKLKRYDSDVKSKGDVLHIPELSDLTAHVKVHNTAVTLNAPTDGEKTITIDQHYETSFMIEDIAKVQSAYNLMSEYTNKAGYSIAKTVDTAISTLAAGAGVTQTVGNGSTDITDANIIRAIQYLDEADAPESDRYFVINPAAKADLMAIDKFVLRTGPGWSPDNSPILNGAKDNGFWGDIYGAKVFVSNNLVTTASTPSVVHNILFQKEWAGLAMQQSPRTQSQYKQEYLATLVTVDVLYGMGILRPTFAVDFNAKA